jgi:hypothetical protein
MLNCENAWTNGSHGRTQRMLASNDLGPSLSKGYLASEYRTVGRAPLVLLISGSLFVVAASPCSQNTAVQPVLTGRQ